MTSTHPIVGRCYCGATTLIAFTWPQVISYCHCSDCRRWSGAPVAAFAAFAPKKLSFKPGLGRPISVASGVKRWSCSSCGSPLAAEFDYLPGQIYVPIGILDQAAELAPQLHSHAEACLPWLHIADDLPRVAQSSRQTLLAHDGKATCE